MKIVQLRCSGFRGYKGTIDIVFPSGFAVIVGRNGSGKSTICDAIEFALTGSIRSASSHQEKGESIADYIWWRGDGVPSSRYVELILGDENGPMYKIQRTPSGFNISGDRPLEDVLCDAEYSIDNPLAQVCKTAILRDEDIAKLSVDQREADRFDFVRSSLGTADFSTAERRGRDVQGLLEAEVTRAEVSYGSAVAHVTSLTSQLSLARIEAAGGEGLTQATNELRAFLGSDESSTDKLQAAARRRLGELRAESDRLEQLHVLFADNEQNIARIHHPEQVEYRRSLSSKCTDLQAQYQMAAEELALLHRKLAEAQRTNPTNTSLALLHEHGSRIGLLDGACPLCHSLQSEQEYKTQLESLANRIAISNDQLAALTRSAADVEARLALLRDQQHMAQSKLDRAQEAERQAGALRNRLILEAEGVGMNVRVDPARLVDDIRARLQSHREVHTQVERALSVVMSSKALDQVRTLERGVDVARGQVKSSEQRLSNIKASVNLTKEAIATIRRVQGEYVSEQLAQLEPLMLELYQRLRPHVDWPEVRYRLRGDVRRMLSLEVGDGINPSFVFSSGQRRAAGLAFLLAVHLSRRWCRLNTLILDDPVQHIDDYRALHLTEVLAAIRRTGRQVICTVEDESLGKLLARRLRSQAGDPGVIISMCYTSGEGAHVLSTSDVVPMPDSILLGA